VEGKVKVFSKEFVDDGENKLSWEHSLFYNPATVLNRDISLHVVQSFAEKLREKRKEDGFEGLRVLNAMPNSGIFAMRLLKELDHSAIKSIDVCEREQNAVNLLLKNFELNSIDPSKAKIIHDDPNHLMFDRAFQKSTDENIHSDFFKYDFIDLDAQGSSITYIDAAIKSISEGGLIGASFTDLTSLSSSGNAKCFYMYNSLRDKMPYYQEHAIRIVLYTINTIANRYGRFIKPVISFNSDFYQRVFFTVHSSKAECNKSITKYSNVHYCNTCTNYHVEKMGSAVNNTYVANPANPKLGKCDQCDSPMEIHGPIWSEQINDFGVIKNIYSQLQSPVPKLDLQTNKKIHAMLHTILEERESGNYPLAISMDSIASLFKVSAPSLDVVHTQVRKYKYSIARSYIHKNLWKTNAPLSFIFELVKEWKKVKAKHENLDYLNEIEPGSPAYISLTKPGKYDFDFHKIYKRPASSKLPLFFENPDKNWGPTKRPTLAPNSPKNKEK